MKQSPNEDYEAFKGKIPSVGKMLSNQWRRTIILVLSVADAKNKDFILHFTNAKA